MSALMDLLGGAADVLSTPGGLVRGVLAGRPGEQVSGHDLLSEYGFGPGDGVGGTLAGIGADLATDPLTYGGGALLKLLMGGKLRPTQFSVEGGRLGADAQIMDLVPNWEANAGRLSPRTVHYAEEVADPLAGVPTKGGNFTMEDWFGKDAADRFGDVGPIPEVPNMVDEGHGLFHPEEVGHLIGYGPDLSRFAPSLDRLGVNTASIPGDLLQEGDKLGAFKVALGGWDQVLSDLEALGPAGREALGVGPGGFPTKDLGRYWQDAIGWRIGDLTAANNLGGGFQGFSELEPAIRQQLERLHNLRSPTRRGFESFTDSTTLNAVRDLLSGQHIPGQAAEATADYLGHLPVDPRFLKRLAMQGQRSAVPDELEQAIARLMDEGGDGPVTIHELAGLYEPHFLLQRLEQAVNPNALAEARGLDPNIVRAVMSGPIADQGLAGMLGETRALHGSLANIRSEIAALLHGSPAAEVRPGDWEEAARLVTTTDPAGLDPRRQRLLQLMRDFESQYEIPGHFAGGPGLTLHFPGE